MKLWEADILVCGGVVGVGFPEATWECGWQFRMLTCYLSAQALVSRYHSLLKGTRDPWGSVSFQGRGRGKYKMSLPGDGRK